MVEVIFGFIFWFSFAVIFYAYAGYPVLLYAVSLVFGKPVKKQPVEPFVSVIISAFNEEKAIEQKLLNLLDLDYPEVKLEILVGSDGGSDHTDEIVSRFHSTRIRFFRFVKNLGKPHVLRSLVEEARGEILVFTDTRQEFDHGAVRALVSNFQDSRVGCVSGELFFKEGPSGTTGVGQGMGAYWSYEKFLRKKESEIGSMLGATGAIYAIRKELFPKLLPLDILVDDMYIPFSIISHGYRAVFEGGARAFDRVSEHGFEEFKRKTRTLTGNYQAFFHFPALFNPVKSRVWWQLISHKLLRLVVPFLLISLLISNLFLIRQPVYMIILVSQVLFYGLAFGEMKRQESGRTGKRIGYIPYMFCLLNYSAFIAFIQFVKGKQKVTWERAYE